MSNINKSSAVILILIIAISSLSLLMVRLANAQSIPSPSIPEFTIRFVNSSYVVPITHTIDPYTGANVTHPSYYVENSSIVLTIKNQPYTPFLVKEGSSNWTAEFFYNVRIKGGFENNWTDIYSVDGSPFLAPSNSDLTIVTYPVVLSHYSQSGYDVESYNNLSNSYNTVLVGFPINSQIDFQVQAMIGAIHRGYNASATNQLEMFPWVFTGQTSDWSKTQIIIIPTSSTSPSSTPAVPEFSWLIIMPLLLSVFSVAVVLRHRKQVNNI